MLKSITLPPFVLHKRVRRHSTVTLSDLGTTFLEGFFQSPIFVCPYRGLHGYIRSMKEIEKYIHWVFNFTQVIFASISIRAAFISILSIYNLEKD